MANHRPTVYSPQLPDQTEIAAIFRSAVFTKLRSDPIGIHTDWLYFLLISDFTVFLRGQSVILFEHLGKVRWVTETNLRGYIG